ncbi:MAG: hypothetical protein KGH71_01665 [Candidatus Micrarchaeota archaeon]|nr:hypothetical protein [Candidatus Micrarchaeota archaeon]
MADFHQKRKDNQFGKDGLSDSERAIIRDMRKPTAPRNKRLYGFHCWEGKAQNKNSPKFSDVLLDQSSYSPVLVKKLVDKGISVIYLGSNAGRREILDYAMANKEVILVTSNRDLDEMVPNGKSLMLRFACSFEEKSHIIAGFAKESSIAAPEKSSEPQLKENSTVKQQVVAPTWRGDTEYQESDITSTNIVISSDKPGHSPTLVDQDKVNYSGIMLPAILELTSGKKILTESKMQKVWEAKTVIASIHNARNFIKNAKGIVLSIGAGPTDPVARALEGSEGVSTISLDRSMQYMKFLKGKMGEDEGHLYIVADSRYLPFRDGAVQISASTYLFDKLEGKELALSLLEARRVSKAQVYFEFAPSQGGKKFESVKFLMELCGFENLKSLNYRVSFNNGNSARSYIFTADSKGKPFKEALIRETCELPSQKSEESIRMNRMLATDYSKYRNMNRYFELAAENLYMLLERSQEIEKPTERFVFNILTSAKSRGSFHVQFKPDSNGVSEKIDLELLKEMLDTRKIKYIVNPASKGAVDLLILEVPDVTIRIIELLRTDPTKLAETTREIALEGIYNGVDTEEMMHRYDTKGYWGDDKVSESQEASI